MTVANRHLREISAPGIQKPEDRARLVELQNEERRQELLRMSIPPRVEKLLSARAEQLASACGRTDIDEAQTAAGRLGLRNGDLFDFLRACDAGDRKAYCRLLVDPGRIDRRQNFVRGANLFEQAEKNRKRAIAMAAEGGNRATRNERILREADRNDLDGMRRQAMLSSVIQSVDPSISYTDFADRTGLSAQSLATSFKRYAPEIFQQLVHSRREQNERLSRRDHDEERFERAQRKTASKNEPPAAAVSRAPYGTWEPQEVSPGSVITPSVEQFYRAKARLEHGETPAIDPVGFLSVAYYIAPDADRARAGTGGQRSMRLDNARGGVRLLAEEFKLKRNARALRALARLVEWPSEVLSAQDRDEIFEEPSRDPQPGPGADPFDDRFAKLDHWNKCLDRFFFINSALTEREALEAAAKRLTAQFSANHLLALEQAAASKSDLGRLRRVLTRARALLGDNTPVV